MDFRSSSLVASLALSLGAGSFALVVPATHAGDRLEFSSPAFPLAVPHPVAETKEIKRVSASDGMGGVAMGPDGIGPQEVMVSGSKHRSDEEWDLKPIFGDDQDSSKHEFENWLEARPEPNTASNSATLKEPRGWDAKDSQDLFQRNNDPDFRANQDLTKPGSPLGLDNPILHDSDSDTKIGGLSGWQAEDPGERSRFGRADASSTKDILSWYRAFAHGASENDGIPEAHYSPFGGGTLKSANGRDLESSSAIRTSQGTGYEIAPPSDFGVTTPLDIRHPDDPARLQSGLNQSMRAWEQPDVITRPSARESFNLGGRSGVARVVAPERPINLPFPKRPGDY